MVAFRVGDLRISTLDDAEYAAVLDAASRSGAEMAYPILFSIRESDAEIEPLAFMDEIVRLATSREGRVVAALIGRLRDDLMTGLATAEEG
jgi:hypothetical protein